MSDELVSAPGGRLPFLAVIRETYVSVLGNFGAFLKLLVLPFLLLTILHMGWERLPVSATVPYSLVAPILVLIPYTAFAVSWHRYVLLGPIKGRPRIIPTAARRHFRYFRVFFVVTVAYMVPLIGAGILILSGPDISNPQFVTFATVSPFLLTVLAYLILPYPFARVCFVFPQVAINGTDSFKNSWRRTRGKGLQIYLMILAAGLPIVLISYVGVFFAGVYYARSVGIEIYNASKSELVLVLGLFDRLLDFLTLALVVSAISVAYRTCTGWVPASDSEAVTSNGS